MAGGKGRTLSADVLNASLDGVTFTGQAASAMRCILGTGTPSTTTGLLAAYNTDLGAVAMDSTAGWGTASTGSGLGSVTDNDTAITWTNSTGSPIVVSELGISRSASSPNSAPQILYSVPVSPTVSVGASGTITIAAGALTVTER